MVGDYLDFEKPIAALEKKILDFQSSEEYEKDQLSNEIDKLNESIIKLTEKIYSNFFSFNYILNGRMYK